MTYFFDTYAFMAFDKKSANYERFSSALAVTTRLNQLEYGWLSVRIGKDADIEKLEPYIQDISLSIVKKALIIRSKNKKMSFADAVGYATALNLKIPFLTGDEAFKGLPGVEFVKE